MTASSPGSPARFCSRMLSAKSHGCPERTMLSAAAVTRRRKLGVDLCARDCDTLEEKGRVASLPPAGFQKLLHPRQIVSVDEVNIVFHHCLPEFRFVRCAPKPDFASMLMSCYDHLPEFFLFLIRHWAAARPTKAG